MAVDPQRTTVAARPPARHCSRFRNCHGMIAADDVPKIARQRHVPASLGQAPGNSPAIRPGSPLPRAPWLGADAASGPNSTRRWCLQLSRQAARATPRPPARFASLILRPGPLAALDDTGAGVFRGWCSSHARNPRRDRSTARRTRFRNSAHLRPPAQPPVPAARPFPELPAANRPGASPYWPVLGHGWPLDRCIRQGGFHAPPGSSAAAVGRPTGSHPPVPGQFLRNARPTEVSANRYQALASEPAQLASGLRAAQHQRGQQGGGPGSARRAPFDLMLEAADATAADLPHPALSLPDHRAPRGSRPRSFPSRIAGWFPGCIRPAAH